MAQKSVPPNLNKMHQAYDMLSGATIISKIVAIDARSFLKGECLD